MKDELQKLNDEILRDLRRILDMHPERPRFNIKRHIIERKPK